MATPRPSSLARSPRLGGSAGSQVTPHVAASSLAAPQISYPTPPSDWEIPLPRPQVLEPTTAATVTSDAHTWLAPLRFEITRYSRPASASRAITRTGQNRRTMTSAVIRPARAMDDPACTQAAMLGCTATSGSAMSTDRQTQPWTRSAGSTTSASGDQVSASADLIRALLTSSQSAQLSSDPDTIVAAPAGNCLPAPLSKVCTVARCERANRPNRPLGRLAADCRPSPPRDGSHARSLSERPSW